MKARLLLLCGALLALAGCGRGGDPAPGSGAQANTAVSTAGAVAHEEHSARPAGIAWFDGDMPAAFAAAKTENKPVLIYWGAAWCPPCHLLKATVFAQPEFQAKSRLFIPVFLDGDDAGAQRLGDEFKVSGYPTLVALRPDGTEITRISGGMDLNRYAELLDDALEDQRPVREALAAAQSAVGATPENCRRVAWNAWDLDEEFDARDAALAKQLLGAASHCAKAGATTELRLRLFAATALIPADAPSQGAPFDANSQANAKRLVVLLADTATAVPELDALLTLQADFFIAYNQHDKVAAVRLADLVEAAELKANVDPRYPRPDQLAATKYALRMRNALYGDDAQQAALDKYTRTRLAAEMNDLPRDPYVRSGVVMSVLENMYELGDYPAAYEIAKREVESSPYAYYFMVDMAQICEQLGRTEESLDWHKRAYAASKGPATRFQWGTWYVLALMRMAPDDVETIRKAGHEVLGELDQQGGAFRRTRTSLNRIDAMLTQWSAADPAKRDPVAEELRSAYAKEIEG